MIRLLTALCLGAVSGVAVLNRTNRRPVSLCVATLYLCPASEVGLAADVAIWSSLRRAAIASGCVRLIRGPAGAGLPVADIEYGTARASPKV